MTCRVFILLALVLSVQRSLAQEFPLVKKKIALYDSVRVVLAENDPRYEVAQNMAKWLTGIYQNTLKSYQQEHDFTFVKQFAITGEVQVDWAVDVILTATPSVSGKPKYVMEVEYINTDAGLNPMHWSVGWDRLSGDTQAERLVATQEVIAHLNGLVAGSFITSRIEKDANGLEPNYKLAINQIKGDDEAYCLFLTQMMSNAAIAYQKGHKSGLVHLVPRPNERLNVYKTFLTKEKPKVDGVLFGKLDYDEATDQYTLRLELKMKGGKKVKLVYPFQQEISFARADRFSYTKVLHDIKAMTDGLIYHANPNMDEE